MLAESLYIPNYLCLALSLCSARYFIFSDIINDPLLQGGLKTTVISLPRQTNRFQKSVEYVSNNRQIYMFLFVAIIFYFNCCGRIPSRALYGSNLFGLWRLEPVPWPSVKQLSRVFATALIGYYFGGNMDPANVICRPLALVSRILQHSYGTVFFIDSRRVSADTAYCSLGALPWPFSEKWPS